jgi:voltage-gated potassium channel
LRYLLPAAGLVVVLAGGAFAGLESDTVDSYREGLWWALSLVTTIGIVGREPLTTAGHFVAAALMLMGFLLLAMTTAAVASIFVRVDEEPEERALRIFEEHALAELRELRSRPGPRAAGRPRSEPCGSSPTRRGRPPRCLPA